MNFIELAKKRYSVRKYESRQVEEDKIAKILEAGQVAPTAANIQPQRFLVIKSDAGLEKLKKGANIHGAPMAIIICGDHDNVWIRPFDKKNMVDIDTSIATDHMMLSATDMGLGTCWLTYFDPEIIKKEFNIPSNFEPVNILTLGYPASAPKNRTTRKDINEIVFYETF